jgi:hypothetical protein
MPLLTCIAAGKSGLEWHKFSHIQQVKAYADDLGSPMKWYLLYTRDPFCFKTNISRSAIARGKLKQEVLHLMEEYLFIFRYSVLFGPILFSLASFD